MPQLNVHSPWEAEVTKHLIWAVHLAHQGTSSPETRDHAVTELLADVLEVWDA